MGIMGFKGQGLQGHRVGEEEKSGGKWETRQSGIEPLGGNQFS